MAQSDAILQTLLHCPCCRTDRHVSVSLIERDTDFAATIAFTCYACASRWIRPTKMVNHPHEDSK